MKAKGKTLYPFIPSVSHFAEALIFLQLIGFKKIWENENDGLAALRFGDAQFLLFNKDMPEWQANQIVVYEVDDLDRYYEELMQNGVNEKFPDITIGEPQQYPWSREIQFIGLGGVCWHVRAYE